MDKLKLLSESLLPILTLMSILVLGFFISMGLFRKYGKEEWLKKKTNLKTKHGKIILKQFPNSKAEIVFWKDPSLINKGFSSFIAVWISLLYVVFMFIFYPLIENISILLLFPNLMLGVTILAHIIKQKIIKHCILQFIFAGACVVISYLIIEQSSLAPNRLLVYQLLILVAQSLSLSFIDGIIDALKESDIEFRFPLVEITTTSGKNINNLRFSFNTDADYRFINSDGTESIFPREHIYQIKILEEKS